MPAALGFPCRKLGFLRLAVNRKSRAPGAVRNLLRCARCAGTQETLTRGCTVIQMRRYPVPTVALALALLGCDAAEGVQVEPLPPLTRPTPEQRAGLPELKGAWRFAGWEVATPEIAARLGEPRVPGEVRIRTQRLDSLGGFFMQGEAGYRLSGEVRRDGVVAFAASTTAGTALAAGRVRGDTLWLELSTLPTAPLLEPGVRWAFVRSAVGQPFLRLPNGVLLRDTVVAAPAGAGAAVETAAVAGADVRVPAQDTAARADPAQAPLAPEAPRPATDTPRTRTDATAPGDTGRARQQPAARDTARRPQRPPGPEVDIPPRW